MRRKDASSRCGSGTLCVFLVPYCCMLENLLRLLPETKPQWMLPATWHRAIRSRTFVFLGLLWWLSWHCSQFHENVVRLYELYPVGSLLLFGCRRLRWRYFRLHCIYNFGRNPVPGRFFEEMDCDKNLVHRFTWIPCSLQVESRWSFLGAGNRSSSY